MAKHIVSPVAPQSPANPQPAPAVVATPNAPAPAQVAQAALDSHVVALLVAANPKRSGSKAHARWSCYKHGITVGALKSAMKSAGWANPASDLRWAIKHGFVALVPPGQPVPAQPVAAAAPAPVTH